MRKRPPPEQVLLETTLQSPQDAGQPATPPIHTAGAPSTPRQPAPPPMPMPDKLGPYRVVGELGAGGFGVVYEAIDEERNQLVAVKTLREFDVQAVQGLRREFRHAADLNHPNLARLHELVFEDGQCFLVMALVHGVDFLAWVRAAGPDDDAKPLHGATEARLRAALLQLAQGVHALHEAGLLHLDLKPSNVLVEANGRVVILDFGLVQRLADAADPTRAVRFAGTPAYMSPEQGLMQATGPASDWYSFGTMLWAALCGRTPYTGTPFQVLGARATTDAAAPSSVRRGIPEDLNDLCVRLLARNPADRPAGAEVLRQLGLAPKRQRSRSSGYEQLALIGRDDLMGALRATATHARTKPVAVWLLGAPGVGKTALANQFAAEMQATHHVQLLTGRCYERESAPFKGFDAIAEAMDRQLQLDTGNAAGDVTRARAALHRLFGTVHAETDDDADEDDLFDPAAQRKRAFRELKQILRRMAHDRLLILILDDAQWGDLDGARLLVELLSPPEPPPMLVICTCRSDDFERSGFVREVRSGGGSGLLCTEQMLTVPPLAEREAEQLAARLVDEADDGERSAAIARESRGNPFLLSELARWSVARPAGGPEATTLDDVIRDRAAALGATAQNILQVVAIAGRPTPQQHVLAAAGEAKTTVIDDLRRAALVRVGGSRGAATVEPFHDRIRECVVNWPSPAEAAALHGRLADALARDPATEPQDLAHHLHGSGRADLAAVHLWRAAELAERALAFDKAAGWYGEIIEWGAPAGKEVAVRQRRAQALFNAGRCAEAAPVWLEAAACGNAVQRSEFELQAAQAWLVAGHIDAGLGVLMPLLAAHGLPMPRSPAMANLRLLGSWFWLRMRGIGYVAKPESSCDAGQLLRADMCWSAGKGLLQVMPSEGADAMLRSLRLALQAGEPVRIGRALTFMGAALANLTGSQARVGNAWLAEALRIVEQTRDPYLRALAEIWQAFGDLVAGRWQATVDRAQLGLSRLGSCGAGLAWETNVGELFRMAALTELGQLLAVERAAEVALREAAERGDRYGEVVQRQFLAWGRLAADDPDGARFHARESMAAWTRSSYTVQHFYATRAELSADLYQGRVREVVARWPEEKRRFLQAHLDETPMSRIEAWLLEARMLLAQMAQGGAGEPALLAQVMRLARRMAKETRPDAAGHALWIQAAVALRLGDVAGARTQLRSAMQTFARCEMAVHAACAHRRLAFLDSELAAVPAIDRTLQDLGVGNPQAWTALTLAGLDPPQRLAGPS